MKKQLCIIMAGFMILFAGNALAGRSTSIAHQAQGQGQGQSQSQNQANILANSGNSAVAFNNSFNGSKPIRYLPVASDVQYMGLSPQMFSRPQQDKGDEFISAKNLVSLMGAWKVSEISDEDFDEDDVTLDITTFTASDSSVEDISADGDSDTVTFSLQGTTKANALNSAPTLAIGTIKSTSEDVNTPELFMVLAKKAKELGASNIVLIGEGVKVELASNGWGIGFSYNYAGVNSDGHGQGQVGAGGTGISGGKASYSKMPYLMFALKK